jgi:hypothetical protein
MNLARDQMKLTTYIDLQDGPSGLQKTEKPTMYERKKDSVFERERESHMNTIKDKVTMLTNV